MTEEFNLHVILGKSYPRDSCTNTSQTYINGQLLLKKLGQPFSYSKRKHLNCIEGAVEVVLLGIRSLEAHCGEVSGRSHQPVYNVAIVLSYPTGCDFSTPCHRRARCSRQLRRLASRSDCHILAAQRTRVSLSAVSYYQSSEEQMNKDLSKPAPSSIHFSVHIDDLASSLPMVMSAKDDGNLGREGSWRGAAELFRLLSLQEGEGQNDLQWHRVFVLHKPLGVVSSTVDGQPPRRTLRDPRDAEWGEGEREREGEEEDDDDEGDEVDRSGEGEGRPTVYDLARSAGFLPSSSSSKYSLVGRLDAATSGLVMFTDDPQLARNIRDPDRPDLGRGRLLPPAVQSSRRALKTKEYRLTLLTGKRVLKERRERLKAAAGDGRVEELLEDIMEQEAQQLLRTLTEPFSFRKATLTVNVAASEGRLIRRYQNAAFTMGRPDLGLGWCFEVSVFLREGKHHQIRRAVKRTGFVLPACL